MNTLNTKLLIAVFACLGLFTLPASAATRHVDCDAGGTISAALETGKGSANVLEIFVNGTCNEVITIVRDHVTIAGDPYATINGTVRVFTANRVTLENLAITGPGDGVIISGTGQVRLRWVYIAGNDGYGLNIRRDGAAWVRDSMIVGDCIGIEDVDCEDGAFVDHATLELARTTISNSRYGIMADAATLILFNAEIADNSVIGVQVALHSTVDIRSNTRFHGNGVHSLYALQDSAIRIKSDRAEIGGHIGCEDGESSLAVPLGFPVWTDCSGF